MHLRLIELEYFRVLLKYVGTWPVSSPVLVHGIRAAQVAGSYFRSLSRPVSVQGKPILFFILPCASMPLNPAHSLSFPDDQFWHRTDSAAPLNPFIGTKNRII